MTMIFGDLLLKRKKRRYDPNAFAVWRNWVDDGTANSLESALGIRLTVDFGIRREKGV